MSGSKEADIRLDLARGHWALREHDDAIFCLERCADVSPEHPQLAELAEIFREELEQKPGKSLLLERLYELQARLQPEKEESPNAPAGVGPALATPTLASLLAGQGHADQALEVVEGALKKNPEDERALAVREQLQPSAALNAERVAELERWLHNLRGRSS